MILVIFTILIICFIIMLVPFIKFSVIPLPIVPFLLFILLLLIVPFIYKVRRQCKQYGVKNVFRMSYHGKSIEMNDYIYMMLNQNKDYHIIKQWEDKFLVLTEDGIYLFTWLYGRGIITGNVKDELLFLGSGKHKIQITNPLNQFQNLQEQLETIIDCSITAYLVIENHSQFLVPENKIETIWLKDVYNTMMKPKKKQYTIEQLLVYSQVVDKWLSNNVNNSVIA